MYQAKVSGILLPQDKQSDSLRQTLPGYIFHTYKKHWASTDFYKHCIIVYGLFYSMIWFFTINT